MFGNIINNIKKQYTACGNTIFDLKNKIIALAGLFLCMVQVHLPVYKIDGTNVTTFGFWLLDKGKLVGSVALIDAVSGFPRFINVVLLVVYWVMLFMACINICNYREPFKKFWLFVFIGYCSRILFSAAYFINVLGGINKYYSVSKKYKEIIKMNHFNTLILATVCFLFIITIAKTTVSESKHRAVLHKKEIRIMTDDGEVTTLCQTELDKNLYLDETSGELYKLTVTKTRKYTDRLSDEKQFDVDKSTSSSLLNDE